MKKLNVLQIVALMVSAIIVGLLIGVASAKADNSHHRHDETTVNNYSISNVINTNGLAAIYAATQIHHAENISGVQLGGGIAQFGDRFGFAAGAALNVPGRAMFNGSVAKEGDETFFGLGINLSIKP